MDPQRVREWEAQCTEEQPPACVAVCPVHVDARALVERVRVGDFKKGFAILAKHVPFPRIVSRTCDRPCESACKRLEAGEAVRIGALERACADYGSPAPERPRLRTRSERVAIVGGGLSGLTAAVELGFKGYRVEVFEAQPVLLGRLRLLGESVLPHAMIEDDLAALSRAGVEVHCSSPITGGTGELGLGRLLQNFDAVYLGIGMSSAAPLSPELGVASEGQIVITPVTFATRHPKAFAGGSHRYTPEPYSALRSLQDGLCAALSIERLLQGASLTAQRASQGPLATRLHVDTSGVALSAAVVPADTQGGYSKEEAVREAERCLPCHCLACVKVCEYLAHYKSYPKRYVREIYNNDCIVMGAHLSNRMVNSCTLCGLCASVCPEKLSMAEVCIEARQSLVAKGKMPPTAHDFALQDMDFSLSESFSLARHQPGFDTSAAVFFPGCQLCGSSPDQVAKVYEQLQKEISGGVGLMLGCCGAPAQWAGRVERFQSVLRAFSEQWDRLGRPARLLTACSSCHRLLSGALPQMRIESLWTVLETSEPASPVSGEPRARLALHDPCTTRGEQEVQDAVRRLLALHGVDVVELNERDLNPCCGFGGLARFVNPEVAGKIIERRIHENTADYVTYCAMCRDSFARQGKRTVHLLDILFESTPGDPAARPDPGFSQRRENRAKLKARLLREVWKEPGAEEALPMSLTVPPEVLARMERRMILVEDVRMVIAHAESTGEKLQDPESGHFLAAHRPAAVTYWVEYSAVDGGYLVHNAYSHRMQVS